MQKEKPLKYNDGKPMMGLIRPEFLEELGKVLTHGFTKYGEEKGEIQNYLKGEGFFYSDIYDSLQRHLNAFWRGEAMDESGAHHLACAAANIMFLYTYEISEKGKDNRTILDKDVDWL